MEADQENRIVEPMESIAAAPNVGRDQREFARPGVSSHGEACRSSRGPIGGNGRMSREAMKGGCRGRDARPAMLLPALQARRLSTRSSFSKSVPCNIIVLATGGSSAAYYLKPKVFSVEPSTRVTGLSEKMSLHTISPGVPVFRSSLRYDKALAPPCGGSAFRGCGAYLTRQLVYG
ncbi:hypothetical protein [Bradyrhizobium genosp. A]|uniref:hypothetical protein n=1 Tax=Bradyrhizobium genosp. A TaxID=83626 RepID=UPI003CECE0D5